MKRWSFRLALIAAVIALRSLVSLASDNPFLPNGVEDRGWPFVRGLDYDGHSSEVQLADEWPADGPPVLWTRELGQGYSAIVSVGRRCFTQTQSLAGQFVVCLDADTGRTIWEHRYDLPYELVGVYPGPRATPTIFGGRVFFAAPNGLIGCLSASDGRSLWSVNVIEKYHGEGTDFGYSCSPTVIDDLVILPVGGKGASMVALRADDGREVWKSGDDPASYTPAYPITREGRPLVVGYLQNALVICDRCNGTQLARYELSQGYDEHSAWPIYREPHLWISRPFKAGSMVLTVPRFDDEHSTGERAGDLKLHSKNPLLSNDIVSSVLVGEHVFGFDLFEAQAKTHRASRGIFRCVEMLSGSESWSVGTGRPRRDSETPEQATGEIGQAGIVAADGKLILLNELGELILFRASSDKFEQLARTSVLAGEIVWTPPTLHRGRIFVRNHSRAVCVYVGKPDRLPAGQRTLKVADVPQSRFRDWAATILAIEPEYAFDIPSDEWLWKWFATGLSLLAISQIIGWSVSCCCGGRSTATDQRREVVSSVASQSLAFVGGCLGTTFLSGWLNEFIFMWPLPLFIAFECIGQQLRSRNEVVLSARLWKERAAALFWLATTLAYFLLCRRLSLIFEWMFLIGPIGAIPIQLFSNRWRKRHPTLTWPNRICESILRLLAFASFFAVSVAGLKWKY